MKIRTTITICLNEEIDVGDFEGLSKEDIITKLEESESHGENVLDKGDWTVNVEELEDDE